MRPPFHAGQRVIATNAMPKAKFKNGQYYTVRSCHYSPSGNPIAEGKSFWYIGVHGLEGDNYRPTIFKSLRDHKEVIKKTVDDTNEGGGITEFVRIPRKLKKMLPPKTVCIRLHMQERRFMIVCRYMTIKKYIY